MQDLHTKGASRQSIAMEPKCCDTMITNVFDANIAPPCCTKRGRKTTITGEIPGYIETLCLLDALLTNTQIKDRLQEPWSDVKVGTNTIPDARLTSDSSFDRR
jgi:hypothetical protein